MYPNASSLARIERDRVRSRILEAIRSGIGGPFGQRIVTRQYIECFLKDLAPSEVTRGLKSLRLEIDEGLVSDVGYGEIDSPSGGKPTLIFWYGATPKSDELADFSDTVRRYDDLLKAMKLGALGERYIRSLLKASDRFARVTRLNDVGLRSEGRDRRADIRATVFS